MMMIMLVLQANDLVFIKNSPDYCHSNHTIGSLGQHHYDDDDDGGCNGEHDRFEFVIEQQINSQKLSEGQKNYEDMRLP